MQGVARSLACCRSVSLFDRRALLHPGLSRNYEAARSPRQGWPWQRHSLASGMDEGNEAKRFAAAETGIQAKDCCRSASLCNSEVTAGCGQKPGRCDPSLGPTACSAGARRARQASDCVDHTRTACGHFGGRDVARVLNETAGNGRKSLILRENFLLRKKPNPIGAHARTPVAP
jgi:hypothetical protein